MSGANNHIKMWIVGEILEDDFQSEMYLSLKQEQEILSHILDVKQSDQCSGQNRHAARELLRINLFESEVTF